MYSKPYLMVGPQTSTPSMRDADKHYNPSHSNTQYPNPSHVDASPPSPSQGDGSDEPTDYFHGVFEYLNEMLMEEEDLENKPCMLADSLALQAVEQSFYDTLVDKHPPPDQHLPFALPHSDNAQISHDSNESSCSNTTSFASIQQNSSTPLDYFVEPDCPLEFEPFLPYSSLVNSSIQPSFNPMAFTNFLCSVPLSYPPFQVLGASTVYQDQGKFTHFFPRYCYVNYGAVPKEDSFGMLLQQNNRSSRKRNVYQESSGMQECRSSKQIANYCEESLQLEVYDKVLLCRHMNPQWEDDSEATSSFHEDNTKLQEKGKKSRRPRGGKNAKKKEIVDLRSLLLQCSEAVSNNDIKVAEELLRGIRKHSSSHGDSIERLAHYFSNALDARLAGTGTSIYRAFSSTNISAAQILTSYLAYIKECPFHRISNIFANKSIGKLARGRERLHIIDLGILYGFQWPCIIQGLSLQPGGPPRLRITGIDLPQPGFRPSERVEETGRRLAKYCERFGVPFEYKAIAKKWDDVQVEDLEIDRDEVVVVNSIYRLRCVPDETVGDSRARDKVLNLIKKINPDMFVFGVLNGRYNVPFFQSRAREVISHFSTLFDMFESTRPLEDRDRFLFEQEVFGRDIMNVIACEGTSRVERPETYKKWQERNAKTGFRQMPLDHDIVKEVRMKVKVDYHKDFVVDEDSNWLLQGWKGRILYALSLWKPME